MTEMLSEPVLNFYRYPDIGAEDWDYAFATAEIRALETSMLSRSMILDMANAGSFENSVEILSATQYSLPGGGKDSAEVEGMLKERRSSVRRLFCELVLEDDIKELLLAREDFANMRLALRRKLKEIPIGTDYSDEGSIPADQFEQIFEEENYSPLPLHMQEAIETAVLAYYEDKNIRKIDYALDAKLMDYRLTKAEKLKNPFLRELFRMYIDLTNLRTMLRLKFTGSERRDVFLTGGYIDHGRLKHGIDLGYEAIAPLFSSTPYNEVVEQGVLYLSTHNSFLKVEQQCESHMMGFLKTTSQITSGVQTIIAYLLMKEKEIRTVRLILTGKKNGLANKLLLDRIGE